MPSDKKRINLTIPDNIYQQLQTFKADNGITNDAHCPAAQSPGE